MLKSTIFCLVMITFITLPLFAQDHPTVNGKTVFWVANWNLPSYSAIDEPDTGQIWPAKKDQQNGVYYDARLLLNFRMGDNKVYFTDDYGEPCYFFRDGLTPDPRKSASWLIHEPVGTIWESIENGAHSKDHPTVTRAIIDHMVRLGVVEEGEFAHMAPKRVFEVMEDYTRLAYETVKE